MCNRCNSLHNAELHVKLDGATYHVTKKDVLKGPLLGIWKNTREVTRRHGEVYMRSLMLRYGDV